MANVKTDYIVVGAGILGLSIARELLARNAARITIIDKENEIGLHSSGRNSGVLHAGIYYPADSLKAQFCLKGNKLMQEYCQENKLPINHCGKMIVAKNESEIPSLNLLFQRAQANGARVEIIDEKQLSEIEPNAKTCEKALYSYNTSVIDPKKILNCLYEELKRTKRVEFIFDCAFIKPLNKNAILTSKGKIEFGVLINTAGSFADKVAHSFGLAKNLSLLPFKGYYKKLKPQAAELIRGNIYQVPNLKNPFLGIHFTRNISGDVYVGPTAIPVLGRENYSGLKGLGKDTLEVSLRNIELFLTNKQFRHVAYSELKKYWPKVFFNDAKRLVKQLSYEDLQPSQKVGIRPQLIDWAKKELIMDFVLLSKDNTVHVLNAVSPAFTSAFAFSEHAVSQLIQT